MKKIFVVSLVILLSVSCSYAQDSITFSPLELLNQRGTSSSGVLSFLKSFNPEDFLTCTLTGSPEVVRDKANTFRVNAEIAFDTENYYGKFIPEITGELDSLSDRSRRNSGNLVELYDNGAFGPKYYAFNSENAQRVSEAMKEFRTRALRLKGIKIVLQDTNMRTIHEIMRPLSLQYFVFETSEGNNKSLWTISARIINFMDNKRDVDTKVIIPVEFEIPSSILSDVRNMKAELMIEGHESGLMIGGHQRKGWFGVGVSDVTAMKAKELRLGSTEGAMINSVAKGGPADKAGLKHGDVILALNGEQVINGVTFAQKIGTFNEGDEVILIVNRDGRAYNVRITLGARP